MSLAKCLLVVFCVAVMVILARGQALPDENCLGCICEGSSSCNVTTACHVPYAGAYFCGPFLISYAYWTDAGKPVLGNDDPNRKGAFEACTLDLQCAAQVVRNYMTKFSQDCDGDGVLTCNDYMRIHKLGGYACTGPIESTEYYQLYSDCNEDGIINCEDFVRIHGLGGYGCKDEKFLQTEFYKRYTSCFGVIDAASIQSES